MTLYIYIYIWIKNPIFLQKFEHTCRCIYVLMNIGQISLLISCKYVTNNWIKYVVNNKEPSFFFFFLHFLNKEGGTIYASTLLLILHNNTIIWCIQICWWFQALCNYQTITTWAVYIYVSTYKSTKFHRATYDKKSHLKKMMYSFLFVCFLIWKNKNKWLFFASIKIMKRIHVGQEFIHFWRVLESLRWTLVHSWVAVLMPHAMLDPLWF